MRFIHLNNIVSKTIFVFPFTARLTVCHRTLATDTQGQDWYHSCDDVTRHSDPVTALGSHHFSHSADDDLRQYPRSVNWKKIKIKHYIYIIWIKPLSESMHAHSIYKIHVRHILHMQGLSVRQFVGWVFLFSFLANVTKAHNLDTGIYYRHYHHYLPPHATFYSFLSATLDHLFWCTGAEARETNKLSLSLFVCCPVVFVSSDRPKAAYRKCRVFRTMREMHNRWPHVKVKYRTAFTLFYSKINPKRSMNPFEESVAIFNVVSFSESLILNLGGRMDF